MNEKMRRGLVDQVTHELQAFYAYLAMANYFETENLPGFADWFRAQADEEKEHAERLIRHLHDRNARVELDDLERPRHDFDSPLDVARAGLEHERKVTAQIHDLVELAEETEDHAAESMLEWFVEEQVEEERTFSVLVGQLERVGDEATGVMLLDDRLGARGGGADDGEGSEDDQA